MLEISINQIVMLVMGILTIVIVVGIISQFPQLREQIPIFSKGKSGQASQADVQLLISLCRTWHQQLDMLTVYMPAKIADTAPKVLGEDTSCNRAAIEGVEDRAACKSVCSSIIYLSDHCDPASSYFGFQCLNPVKRGVLE